MTVPPLASSLPAFSSRASSLVPSATLAVTARTKALRAAGHDVIGFGAGEPDFDTPEPIKAAAIAALRDGMTGYQPVPGTDGARRAIADRLVRENGIDCAASDIVITVGGKSALALALQAVVDPGREVILPTPCWVSYRPMAELCGAAVVEVPGDPADGFRITPGQLADAITPRTAAVVFNSPSNPCGTMYAPDELRAIGDVLAAHDHVWVISDEIYEKLIYGDDAHFSLGSIPALRERVITVNGLSKAYAMTGWRLGYLCAPGGDGAVAKMIARLQGQFTSHATSFAYPAIEVAMTQCATEVESMRRVFAQRAERLYEKLAAVPGLTVPRPTGAFYAFPDVSAWFGTTSPGGRPIDDAVSFAEALLDEGLVAVVPGNDFGACARSHVRLSFCCSDEKIDEGCRRLIEWLGTFGPGHGSP